MTHEQIIAELVHIWHSPHLDLSLKAGLAEAIETLKEKNRSDSLVTDSSDACKESESKLDLISRQDAIKTVIRMCAPICDWELEKKAYTDCVIDEINSLPSAEPKTGEWVWSDEDASWMCGACCCVFEEIDWKPNYNFCPHCGARMKGADDE